MSTLDTEKLLLDSVNILLQSINELPITDEEDYDNIIEAQQARSILIEVKRAVLSEGWDLNTDDAWKFAVDVNGEIPVPFNVLDISTSDGDVINRGWRLYSKSQMSYEFDDVVTAKVIWDMDFNHLTHALRHYVTIRAARIFQARNIGDREMIVINEADEEDARLAARRSETRTGNYNMLGSTYGQNYRVRS